MVVVIVVDIVGAAVVSGEGIRMMAVVRVFLWLVLLLLMMEVIEVMQRGRGGERGRCQIGGNGGIERVRAEVGGINGGRHGRGYLRVTVICRFRRRRVGVGAVQRRGAQRAAHIQSQRLRQMRRRGGRLEGVGLHGERNVTSLDRRRSTQHHQRALRETLVLVGWKGGGFPLRSGWIELLPRNVDDMHLLRRIRRWLPMLLLQVDSGNIVRGIGKVLLTQVHLAPAHFA